MSRCQGFPPATAPRPHRERKAARPRVTGRCTRDPRCTRDHAGRAWGPRSGLGFEFPSLPSGRWTISDLRVPIRESHSNCHAGRCGKRGGLGTTWTVPPCPPASAVSFPGVSPPTHEDTDTTADYSLSHLEPETSSAKRTHLRPDWPVGVMCPASPITEAVARCIMVGQTRPRAQRGRCWTAASPASTAAGKALAGSGLGLRLLRIHQEVGRDRPVGPLAPGSPATQCGQRREAGNPARQGLI